MLQDIAPHKFYPEMREAIPAPEDYILYFDGASVLLDCSGAEPTLPTVAVLEPFYPAIARHVEYLFAVDERAFFMVTDLELKERRELRLDSIFTFRQLRPQWLAFAVLTGSQLYRWRLTRTFCGRCGDMMTPLTTERALQCGRCRHIEYPRIVPSVIVGVIDGDRLLMVRHAESAYRRWALVAGFVEIGETPEDTVRREVMEEVGLHVTDVSYYGSQPWALADLMAMGFFARLQGSDEITLNRNELSAAQWIAREDIEPDDDPFSLTQTMIEAFRRGEIS
ncbi:MAG: NAD(+) diphosphatase [Syntrophomonadaceae bacterium]|nr:NAD(+) diphosphatase [Syntrophomonadaceae bacterium]